VVVVTPPPTAQDGAGPNGPGHAEAGLNKRRGCVITRPRKAVPPNSS
jgi:hypothetical protein